jgi:hypothetical protein
MGIELSVDSRLGCSRAGKRPGPTKLGFYETLIPQGLEQFFQPLANIVKFFIG